MRNTHHSKALKATDAWAAEQTRPEHRRSLKKTASAMKPANQKIIVTASTARMANL